MNLTKCEKGHFYDADNCNECPHCNSKVNTNIESVDFGIGDGGIVMHKCMWCGAENAMDSSEIICPSCHNNLDGSHNDFINASLSHFEFGEQCYRNREFDKAEKEFLEFLKIESTYDESKKYQLLIRSRMIYEQDLIELINEDKRIFNVSVDIDHVYYALGTIEVERKNLLKAREYLRKAIEWNPVYVAAFFEYAETFKMEGNLDAFYTITKNAYDKIFLPDDLARYYRNLGFYFIEKENYNLATCLFLHSLSFDDNGMAKSEIVYIKQKIGSLNIPEPDVAKKILEENDMPTFISNRCYALLDKHGLLNKQEEHFCPQCGENVDKDASFCSKCGKDLKENQNDTLMFCPVCNEGTCFGDPYCRNCGSKIELIHAEKALTDESDIRNAQEIIEKLIRLYNIDSSDEYHLSMLLELIKYVPLYLPVNIDVEAMLGGKDPLDLKIGEDITLEEDVKAKIATVKTDEFELVPLFTRGEYTDSSVMRFYPSDYLPIITKMNLPAVINIFNNYKFVLPEQYLKNMLASIELKEKEERKHQNKVENVKKYCPLCGAEFDGNAEFCAYCGTKTETKSVSNKANNDNVEIVIGDRYNLIKKISENTHNNTAVYLAMDTKLNKMWAAKVLDKRKMFDTEKLTYQLNAFISQAEFLKKLNYPTITRVVDIGENDDLAYIIMDYVEGDNLQSVLDQYGPQSEELVINWAIQVCDTIKYLWSQNPPIIHRDIKPHNIKLQPNGSIKLMDFSIAREYISGLEKDETTLGTRGFAAPEQYGTAQTDCRTDIFDLGVTMFYLVTGVNPTKYEGELPDVRTVKSDISGEMGAIIKKCTNVAPDKRYQTPEKLSKDLNALKFILEKRKSKKGLFGKLFG